MILLMFGVGLYFSMRDPIAVRYIAVPGAIVQMDVATLRAQTVGSATAAHGDG